MLRISFFVLMAMLLAGQGYCTETAQAPKEFGGVVTSSAKVTAVVTAIDYTTRYVTLQKTDGTAVTFKAGPEVKRLEDVAKGDTVTIDYSERVQIALKRKEMAPMRQETVDITRATGTEKPAGAATATMEIYAVVEAIDYAARTVTLKGPEKTLVVKADDDAAYFNSIKVGDTVYVNYTQQMIVSVTK